MTSSYSNGFTPRRGSRLRVLIVARISTEEQDEQSLQDQIALCRRYLAERYDGPIEEVGPIATQGSGERKDRPELEEIRRHIRSGTLDVLISEDLGRILRRNAVYEFGELCEDHGVRLIAINDLVDTADPSWKMHVQFRAMHHEQFVEDAARRVRRSMDNRFEQGILQTPPCFGYCRDESGGLRIDEELRPFVLEIFDRVDRGEALTEIATSFNVREVPLRGAPQLKRTKWTGPFISKLVRRSVYSGVLTWGLKRNRRNNETGRRLPRPGDPSEVRTQQVPHLAIITPERHARILDGLRERNARRVRGGNGSPRPPRSPGSRTRFPATHIRCRACGRAMYIGQAQTPAKLACSGAPDGEIRDFGDP